MKRALLVLPFVLVGCKNEIDSNLLVKTVEDGTAAKHLKLKTLDCPKGRPVKSGDVFTCTGMSIEGQPVTIQVTQKDDEGNVQWELQGMILEVAKIKSDILPKLGDGIALACPHEVTVTAIGETTTCKITKDGETGQLHITMDDAQGNVSYKVEK